MPNPLRATLDILLDKFMGRGTIIGEKQFKQKVCSSFRINEDKYNEVVKELNDVGSIEYKRGLNKPSVIIRNWW
jgi:hypothetical protein